MHGPPPKPPSPRYFRAPVKETRCSAELNLRNLLTLPNRNEAAWGYCMEEDAPVILVVEDDDAIQAIIEDALSDGGFETDIVGSGEEAVKLLLSDQRQYRALVTDINLAGELDGWAVARKAREINAEFPIVYMTGADAEKWPINGVPNSILLNKPFARPNCSPLFRSFLTQRC